MTRKSTDRLTIPHNYKQLLDEIKQTVTVLESIIESLGVGERAKDNDVAQDLAATLKTKQPKVVELIEQEISSGDEKLVSTLFLLHDKIDR